MSMMDAMFGTTTQWPIYTLIIVVVIFGLISVYLTSMILMELKESRKSLEKMETLLKSVE